MVFSAVPSYYPKENLDHFIWLLNLVTLANSEITPQVVYSSLYPSMQSEQTKSKDEIDGCQLFIDNFKILMKWEDGSFHLAAKFGDFSK